MTLTEKVSIRLAKDEKDQLQEEAEVYEISLSDYLRLKLITVEVELESKVVSVDWETYHQLGETIHKLRKIGTNINQLAHNANLSIMMGSPMQLQLAELNKISNDLHQSMHVISEMREGLAEVTGRNLK